ncbi:lipopolysaccharide assembly protein LapA domain-containing protein [Acidovorax sp. SUPP950]|uniref:LapA family protein n=1 Tax=unclassified Acidovorax TaxID=2684926 RepID=UPI002348F16F|nr:MULTISPECIES: lipopolysaccharide assembly protein LapA domain-containing protein [Comamonadaceae]WCM99709.1 lipopolysaccharide assembly protein LapA domain-containing protein [Acidovorax sp. GBBC 1281]WOI46744.1 lipopolysaccharide assembly protein LapA domain-containing protein [Paracidovorax avenae]GKS73739.1 lipopolysaccharide assembly protein LapA domain-containing protein [Acidovorax sp. SUPP950]GKS86520.1 lipopolysaccharide assembly protein LapA domain-containing protein [Acidovorax sp.
MKYLLWLLKAAIFFTLFAFALNNQQDATVHFFFGTHWSAPLVLVVLTAFAAGVVVGVLGMVPRWWKHRSAARRAQAALPAEAPAPAPVAAPAVPDLQQQPPSIHGI